MYCIGIDVERGSRQPVPLARHTQILASYDEHDAIGAWDSLSSQMMSPLRIHILHDPCIQKPLGLLVAWYIYIYIYVYV